MYNPGDKVKVIRRKYDHSFPIGAVIELKSYTSEFWWLASFNGKEGEICEDDVELYQPQITIEPELPQKTLRDEFAMAVLPSLIINNPREGRNYLIQEAYAIADKMLQVREK